MVAAVRVQRGGPLALGQAWLATILVLVPVPVVAIAAAVVVVVSAAANGKVAYTYNSVMSCAGCHGMPPSMQKVLNGANSPNTILNAINSNAGGMGMYSGKLSTQQLSDIAAYLATPNI